MPPKKQKLHELAVEVPMGTPFSDASKKLDFTIGKQFATGGFGRIYTCKQKGVTGDLVVKVEPFANGPLFTEISVFNRILKKSMLEAYSKQNKGVRVGLPWIVAAGSFDYKGEKLRYMVMPKYETSLESIREKTGKLSPSDTWNVAAAGLNSLQYMHQQNYVHADIKAGNILLEKASDKKTAVLVDFGLARMSASNVDKPDKKRAHNGTALFTSMDAHRGNQPSFRGDIEILAYNVLYWLTGTLPWQQLESSPDKVFAAKQAFTANLSASLQKELKGTAAAALKELFDVALKTGYTEHVDFAAAKKSVERALSSAKTDKPTKTPVAVASSPLSSPEAPPLKKTPVRRPIAKVAPKVERAEKKEKKPVKELPVPGRLTRSSRKRRSEEVEEEEEGPETSDNSAKENKKSKPVSPATKADGEKMRQKVPGMLNLPKGRRSIIINKITKKYQRMAAKNTQ